LGVRLGRGAGDERAGDLAERVGDFLALRGLDSIVFVFESHDGRLSQSVRGRAGADILTGGASGISSRSFPIILAFSTSNRSVT